MNLINLIIFYSVYRVQLYIFAAGSVSRVRLHLQYEIFLSYFLSQIIIEEAYTRPELADFPRGAETLLRGIDGVTKFSILARRRVKQKYIS